ncbi:MAG: YraN family protein [Acidimicrobiia bacterium]
MGADGRRSLGAAGEEAVARHYESLGYRVVDRNWRCREGELDLVLERHGELVFCEVKTRSSLAFGSPVEAITPAKQRRLRILTARWLQEHGTKAADVRIDVAAVLRGTGGFEIEVREAVV